MSKLKAYTMTLVAEKPAHGLAVFHGQCFMAGAVRDGSYPAGILALGNMLETHE